MNGLDRSMWSFRLYSLVWSLSHCLKPLLWRGLWCLQDLLCNLFQSPGLWTGILSNPSTIDVAFLYPFLKFLLCVFCFVFFPNAETRNPHSTMKWYVSWWCIVSKSCYISFSSYFSGTIHCNALTALCIFIFRVSMLIHCVVLFIQWIFIPTHLSTYLPVYQSISLPLPLCSVTTVYQ